MFHFTSIYFEKKTYIPSLEHYKNMLCCKRFLQILFIYFESVLFLSFLFDLREHWLRSTVEIATLCMHRPLRCLGI